MRPASRIDRAGLRSAIDAALIMAVGMGFGRFAFTAVYPHMVQEGLLDLHGGSLAASANYFGYLLGALLAVRARAHQAHRLCLISMIGTAGCLAALSVIQSLTMVILVRGVAGLLSALAMVAASLWLLAHRQQMHRAPLLYAGVGLGIASSSELLVLGGNAGLHSPGLWLMLGIVSLIVGLMTVPGLLMHSQPSPAATAPVTASNGPPTIRPVTLVAIYGLAGFGYIITATYLPLLVKTALPEIDAAHVWAVFGLGAVPSCFLWHRLHQRWGTPIALAANLVVQAIGVAVPAVVPTATGYLLSALLVGGTFMGTVTIAMPAAQRAARQAKSNLMATMTLVYGVGQIVGPIAANGLYSLSHNFVTSLIAAAVALAAAALLCLRAFNAMRIDQVDAPVTSTSRAKAAQ